MEINISLILTLLRAILLVLVGIPLSMLVTRRLQSWLSTTTLSTHASSIISNFIHYVIVTLIIVTILHDFGFNLSAFLGAAGIIGIALGLAAQTSISNIISGAFLLLDKALKVGDVIQIAETIGTIEAITLFSVKIRTAQNKQIRVSNEFLLKNTIVNLSYYEHIRIDIAIQVPAQTALHQVQDLIAQACRAHTPEHLAQPVITVHDIQPASITFVAQVWTTSNNVLSTYENIRKLLLESAQQNNVVMSVKRVN